MKAPDTDAIIRLFHLYGKGTIAERVAPQPPAPAAPATLTMTAAANGMTYQQYVDAGWSDDQMIQAGVAIKPSFA